MWRYWLSSFSGINGKMRVAGVLVVGLCSVIYCTLLSVHFGFLVTTAFTEKPNLYAYFRLSIWPYWNGSLYIPFYAMIAMILTMDKPTPPLPKMKTRIKSIKATPSDSDG